MAGKIITVVKKSGFYKLFDPNQYPVKSFFNRTRCWLPEIQSNIKVKVDKGQVKKFRPGDVLDLAYLDLGGKKIRKFTGLCIAIVCRGGAWRFSLRNVLNNVAVEVSFDLASPSVITLGRAQIYKPVSRLRSKLYYLRRKKITDSKV
jgi:ribosomal protein L19